MHFIKITISCMQVTPLFLSKRVYGFELFRRRMIAMKKFTIHMNLRVRSDLPNDREPYI